MGGGASRFAENKRESTCGTKACRYPCNNPVCQEGYFVLSHRSFSRRNMRNWTIQNRPWFASFWAAVMLAGVSPPRACLATTWASLARALQRSESFGSALSQLVETDHWQQTQLSVCHSHHSHSCQDRFRQPRFISCCMVSNETISFGSR